MVKRSSIILYSYSDKYPMKVTTNDTCGSKKKKGGKNRETRLLTEKHLGTIFRCLPICVQMRAANLSLSAHGWAINSAEPSVSVGCLLFAFFSLSDEMRFSHVGRNQMYEKTNATRKVAGLAARAF